MLSKHKPGTCNLNKAKSSTKTLNDKNLTDLNFINKLKPRQIHIDKERLYEENLELKLANNSLKSEMTRLKTKCQQIEKELHKKEENLDERNFYSIKPPNLISNLKSTIKDLKCQLQTRDEEIEKMTKHLKSSKIAELEAEIKAYIDECTRLKHHLEESLQQNGGAISEEESFHEKYSRQGYLLESMTKENQELLKTLVTQKSEIDKLKQKLTESESKKKKLSVKKTEMGALKQEAQKLKELNESLSRSLYEYTSKEANYKDEITRLRKTVKEHQTRAASSERKTKELNNKLAETENRVKRLQNDLSYYKSKQQEDTQVMHFPDPVPILVRNLMKIINQHKITIEILCEGIDKKKTGIVSFEEFTCAMDKYGIKVAYSQFEAVPQILAQNGIFIEKLRVLVKDYENLQSADSKSQTPLNNNFHFETPVRPGDAKSHLFKDNQAKENFHIKDEKPPSKNPKVAKHKDSSKGKLDIETIDIDENEKRPETGKHSRTSTKKKFEVLVHSDDEIRKVPSVNKDDIKKPGSRRDCSSKCSKNSKEDKPKRSKKNSKGSDDRSSRSSSFLTPSINPELLKIFEHISYRMQINRLPKSKLIITLFGTTDKEKILTKNEFLSFFKKHPFNFTDTTFFEPLCGFLLNSKSSVKQISDKLLTTIDEWDIFSQEDEEHYDYELGLIISKNKEVLKEKCKELDKNKTGKISIEDFNGILLGIDISLAESLWKYMKLLFYSNDFQLGVVPYRYFIKAYGNPIEEHHMEYQSMLSENIDTQLVNQYLMDLVSLMTQLNVSVAEVFECDDEGLISPAQFIQGLKVVGFENIDENQAISVVEALRYQGCNELCLHIEEINEIIQSMGVEREPSRNSDDIGPKRISLFPSAQEENGPERISIPDDGMGQGLIKLIRTDSGIEDDFYYMEDEENADYEDNQEKI